MSELPHSTGRSQSGGVVDASLSTESTVPAWLAARRARVPATAAEESAAELEIEFETVSESSTSDPVESELRQLPDPAAPEVVPADVLAQFKFSPPPRKLPPPPVPKVPVLFHGALPGPPPLPTAELRRPASAPKRPAEFPSIVMPTDEPQVPEDNSFKAILLRWVHSASMAGVLTSLVVHTVVVSVLAVLVFHSASINAGLDIIGALDPNADASADFVLGDTSPLDPGKDASPMEFPDMSQLVSNEKGAFDPAESLRGSVGGTGKGSGDGGEDGMGLPALKIPGYAVTKGSFSAWTDPRDPEPGLAYHIVIQFRLPPEVKTYRGSDLTGMVIGTDGYKQAIRLSRTEVFPVRDGVVQVRIHVPGAAKLVRDTIRIESKVLREKQVIEIEF